MTLAHIPYSDGRLLTGTARYASVPVMNGVEPTRRDDLVSLAYVLCYFLRGNLPWMGLKAPKPEIKYAQILKIKKRTSAKELCYGMPEEFQWFLESVSRLTFSQTPSYAEYREKFRALFIRSGFVYDYAFDWPKVDAGKHHRGQPEGTVRTPILRQASQEVLALRVKRTPIIDNPRLVPREISPGRKHLREGNNGTCRKKKPTNGHRPIVLKELNRRPHAAAIWTPVEFRW
jgi:hypothetical protein